jgi:choline kinase
MLPFKEHAQLNIPLALVRTLPSLLENDIVVVVHGFLKIVVHRILKMLRHNFRSVINS